MPFGKLPTDNDRLMFLGAQVRVIQLKAELTTLYKRWPSLRTTRLTADMPETSASTAKRRRRRSNMSAAARAAVSDRMKKYWAARRKNKK